MRFTCPRCNKDLPVTEEQGGQTVSCPACGAILAIPAAEPIPIVEAIPLPPPTAVQPVPSPRRPVPAPWRSAPSPVARTPARRSAAGDAPAWRHTHAALVTQLIATGGFLLGLILIVAGLFFLATDPTPGQKDVTDTAVYRAGGILVLVSWVVAVIGHGFAVMAPGNRGENGLAVTSLLLGIGVVVLAIVIGLQLRALLAVVERPGPRIPGRVRHREPQPILLVLAYLLLLAEGARLTVFAFFQRAVGQSLRDRGLARAGLALGVGVPLLLLGDMLFVFLSAFVVDGAEVPLLAILVHCLAIVTGVPKVSILEVPAAIVFIHFLFLTAVAGWYGLVLLRTRRSVSDWLSQA